MPQGDLLDIWPSINEHIMPLSQLPEGQRLPIPGQCWLQERRTLPSPHPSVLCPTDIVDPAQQFQILSGQDSIQTYLDSDTDSGSVLHRRFCGNCGSTLFVTNETKVAARDMIIVMTGCMDGAKDFVFEREFFYKDRHQSMPKMEGTEKHETMPDWLK